MTTRALPGRSWLIGATVVLLAMVSLAPPADANHGGSSSPTLDLVGQLDLGLPGENVTDVWAYGNYAYLGELPGPGLLAGLDRSPHSRHQRPR